MVTLMRSIIGAAMVFGSLVHGHPIDKADRQVNVAVSPLADPVVVDTIGVYMRTTVLEDGSILGGYSVTDGPDRILRVVKSNNAGDTWEQVGEVDRGAADVREIDNAFPLALPGGRILFAFRNHDKTEGGDYTTYRITLCESSDGGATWSYVSQIDERPASGRNGLWEPFLHIAGDGAIQAYYSAENSDPDQDNLMRVSTDGGLTWGSIVTVSSGENTRDGMIGVTDAGNGNLICVFESTETGPFSVNYVLSSDDGYTWGSRGRIYTAINNRDAGAPQVINVGGTLVTSFMSNEAGNSPGVDNGEMKVVTSSDGGVTWSPATVISGLGSHWPGLHVLDDTTFLALYSFNGLGLVSHKHTL